MFYEEYINFLNQYLIAMKNNEIIFHEIFNQNKNATYPIQKILELGVHVGENPVFGGQSTKIFYALYNTYGFEFLHSLDIYNGCSETIEIVKDIFKDFKLPFHEFIVCNSIAYETEIKYDFIFLDTNHDSGTTPNFGFEGEVDGAGFTFSEINKYSKMLTDNGRFLLHDTKMFYQAQTLGNNVEGAVVKFIRENKDWAFVEHNTNDCGLGELIKINSKIFEFLQSEEKYKNWQIYFDSINSKY